MDPSIAALLGVIGGVLVSQFLAGLNQKGAERREVKRRFADAKSFWRHYVAFVRVKFETYRQDIEDGRGSSVSLFKASLKASHEVAHSRTAELHLVDKVPDLPVTKLFLLVDRTWAEPGSEPLADGPHLKDLAVGFESLLKPAERQVGL